MDQYEDEIDVIGYFQVLYKHRRMVCAVILAGVVFVGVRSLMRPRVYEATATFFPLSTTSPAEAQGFMAKPKADIGDLIISVLESRKMADRIIEGLNLKDVWHETLMTDTRKVLGDISQISLAPNGLIRLSVRAKSPELAAKIANAYVDNLDYFNNELVIGTQRNIVQVIDRAVVPERPLGRGTVKKVISAFIVFFLIAAVLVFIVEFVTSPEVLKRIKGS